MFKKLLCAATGVLLLTACIEPTDDEKIAEFQSADRQFWSADNLPLAYVDEPVKDEFKLLLRNDIYFYNNNSNIGLSFEKGKFSGALLSLHTRADKTERRGQFPFTYKVEKVDGDNLWLRLESSEKRSKVHVSLSTPPYGVYVDPVESLKAARVLYVKNENAIKFLFTANKDDINKFGFDDESSFKLNPKKVSFQGRSEPNLALVLTQKTP